MQAGFVSLGMLYPSLMLDIRYATSHNLAGEPLDGYLASKALATQEAAQALGQALRIFDRHGYGLCIYDAYRPQKAVNHFLRWSQTPENGRTKAEFYPELEKSALFDLGYIALKSGHSRGSTIDLTLTQNGVPLDMGSCFDRMGDISHHDYTALPRDVLDRRHLLRRVMEDAGFIAYENEWWHYRLNAEPYPDTYFDFDIV